MPLNRYAVRYESHEDSSHWTHYQYSVLAETEAQVRAHVDQQCAPEHRLVDSVHPKGHPDYTPPRDSLVIDCCEVVEAPIQLPYIHS